MAVSMADIDGDSVLRDRIALISRFCSVERMELGICGSSDPVSEIEIVD